MFKKIVVSNRNTAHLIDYPKTCPSCHKSITPNWVSHRLCLGTINSIYVFVECPNPDCKICFSVLYRESSSKGRYNFEKVISVIPTKKSFTEILETTSALFVKIYNQAFHAEQIGLNDISGVGYRKALEFLIKDYLIQTNPDEEESIKKKFLGKCIKDYIKNPQIISVAKRAVWLGNDETHYVRKWDGKNLQDMKILIELTVKWIEMEKLTKQFEDEMPE